MASLIITTLLTACSARYHGSRSFSFSLTLVCMFWLTIIRIKQMEQITPLKVQVVPIQVILSACGECILLRGKIGKILHPLIPLPPHLYFMMASLVKMEMPEC